MVWVDTLCLSTWTLRETLVLRKAAKLRMGNAKGRVVAACRQAIKQPLGNGSQQGTRCLKLGAFPLHVGVLAQGFKSSSGTVSWYGSRYGADFENSEKASPVMASGISLNFEGCGSSGQGSYEVLPCVGGLLIL